MATGYPQNAGETETIRQQMQRRIDSAQADIAKAQKMIAFLDAHPEFEEFSALKADLY